ncbi:hypothetical protein AYI68_g5825 [Smittium mucronatum]|uniref:Uncharacterized protein n=1 Tax=Smittium mucronatum TaxID=133383 RepID=A0A1R0GT84_9FUNG|nr:hypothetical protein AYI68_g5825 [Smittium mucronatum]
MGDFGIPVSITELLKSQQQSSPSAQATGYVGRTIRILALIVDISPVNEITTVVDPLTESSTVPGTYKSMDRFLIVKTDLIRPDLLNIDNLYFIIGTVCKDNEFDLYLQANTVSDVNGLDPEIYYKAIEKQREYLSKYSNT